MTTRTTLGLLLALSGALYACGSAGLSSFGADTNEGGPASSNDAGSSPAVPNANAGTKPGGADLAPVDNAVILVHAAKAPSFRLCFENEPDRRPQPDSDVMPEANVVGVEVGAAVRLGPLRGAPGMVYLFAEPLIRAFYPAFGGAGQGPTCNDLLTDPNLSKIAQQLGKITTDLSRGVHLVVVSGCPADATTVKHSVAECGATWTSASGNLSVTEITLSGAQRPSPGILPAQVVDLSQPLEGARAGRSVVVSFGDLTTPGAHITSVTTNPAVFGDAAPAIPASLAYDSTNDAVYASLGFRVSLEAAAGQPDGGATIVLDESLATIQKLSSPRDVPPTYYAAASNYALLLLGDPDPKLADGGADTDERRNLHFLAVPVIAPKSDAGSGDVDAGSGSTGGGFVDGGAGPNP